MILAAGLILGAQGSWAGAKVLYLFGEPPSRPQFILQLFPQEALQGTELFKTDSIIKIAKTMSPQEYDLLLQDLKDRESLIKNVLRAEEEYRSNKDLPPDVVRSYFYGAYALYYYERLHQIANPRYPELLPAYLEAQSQYWGGNRDKEVFRAEAEQGFLNRLFQSQQMTSRTSNEFVTLLAKSLPFLNSEQYFNVLEYPLFSSSTDYWSSFFERLVEVYSSDFKFLFKTLESFVLRDSWGLRGYSLFFENIERFGLDLIKIRIEALDVVIQKLKSLGGLEEEIKKIEELKVKVTEHHRWGHGSEIRKLDIEDFRAFILDNKAEKRIVASETQQIFFTAEKKEGSFVVDGQWQRGRALIISNIKLGHIKKIKLEDIAKLIISYMAGNEDMDARYHVSQVFRNLKFDFLVISLGDYASAQMLVNKQTAEIRLQTEYKIIDYRPSQKSCKKIF